MAEIQYYIQLFFLWLLFALAVRAILTRKKNNNRSPPSPPALPIIGHLHLLSNLPHQSFHKLATRYGPIMQLFLGSLTCVVASSPEIVKEFLKTKETSFSNRYISDAIHYVSYGSKGFVFAPYGEYWKFMKKLCMSELLGGSTLNQLLPLRNQEIRRFLSLLQKKGEAGEAIDVGGELFTLINCVITRMTMSITSFENDNHDVEEIRKMVVDTAELTGKFTVSEFIWFCKNLDFHGMKKRLKDIMDRFDTILERVIGEHEEERKRRNEMGEGGAQHRDLLDILLEIHEDERSEIKLTRENIKAFILDKTAFIFCVEDRALFCEDCVEPVHSAGSVSANHQRFLATGIRVAINSDSKCTEDNDKTHLEPPNNRTAPQVSLEAPSQQVPNFTPSWDVDDLLEFSDFESHDKKESMQFGEMEWLEDVGLFGEQFTQEAMAAAEVPQLPVTHTSSSNYAASHRTSKSTLSNKKPRIEIRYDDYDDEDEFFTVPDLG